VWEGALRSNLATTFFHSSANALPPAEILHPCGSFHPGGTRMLFSDNMEASSMMDL
jgi:hypothetical protein